MLLWDMNALLDVHSRQQKRLDHRMFTFALVQNIVSFSSNYKNQADAMADSMYIYKS